jgi:hypothetical protein
MTKHQTEISDDALYDMWIEPILNRLIEQEARSKTDSQTLSVLREILLKAVKLSSKIVEIM